MTTATQESPATEKAISRYGVQDAALEKMKTEYMPLSIAHVDDREGYEKVHAARMIARKARTSIESKRCELKEECLRTGREIDSEAKRIQSLIKPIEDHLIAEESKLEKWNDEIRRAEEIKAEAERKRLADEAAARLKAEQEARAAELRAQEAELAKQREAMAADQRRIDAERAEQKRTADAEAAKQLAELRAERERLEAERRKVEETQRIERERQAAEQKKIDDARCSQEAENKRLADLEAARLKKIEDDRIAADKAKADAARTEALKPDKEKLLAVANAIIAIAVPSVSTAASNAREQISQLIDDCYEDIKTVVAMMK